MLFKVQSRRIAALVCADHALTRQWQKRDHVAARRSLTHVGRGAKHAKAHQLMS
jgi:hypothetical protein